MKKLLLLLCIILLFVTNNFSQAEELDVVTLNISTQRSGSDLQSSLFIKTDKFEDTAGAQWGPVQLHACFPCESGDSIFVGFTSAVGLIFRKSVGQGRTRFFEFESSSANFASISIPYFYPRNREVKVKKNGQLSGRIKVYEMNAQTGQNRVELYVLNLGMNGVGEFIFAPLQNLSIRGGIKYTNFRRGTYKFTRVDTIN